MVYEIVTDDIRNRDGWYTVIFYNLLIRTDYYSIYFISNRSSNRIFNRFLTNA
ncbi:hypothetical protein SAMN05216316_3031 [Nitrosovibrio sp. Nv6]|nr:hypothetical protein SAMN05216316_3031 [Nitrosovibrio sp. Nv6]